MFQNHFSQRCFIIALPLILALVYCSCSSEKPGAQAPQNPFSIISAEREIWISPLPNGRSGYEYFIKLVVKKSGQFHFDSLIISETNRCEIKVLKGKELYFGNTFSISDTLTIRATEFTDLKNKLDSTLTKVKIQYTTNIDESAKTYYIVLQNIITRKSKPRP